MGEMKRIKGKDPGWEEAGGEFYQEDFNSGRHSGSNTNPRSYDTFLPSNMATG